MFEFICLQQKKTSIFRIRHIYYIVYILNINLSHFYIFFSYFIYVIDVVSCYFLQYYFNFLVCINKNVNIYIYIYTEFALKFFYHIFLFILYKIDHLL